MKGRRPKPTLLHVIAGTNRPRNARPYEPIAKGGLLEAPAGLTETQIEIWRYAIDHSPGGLLRLIDRDLFLGWVRAVDKLNEAEMHLRAEGSVVDKGGSQRITIKPDGTQTKTVVSPTKVPSPWFKIYNAAYDQMIRAVIDLGFSPTSRSRIGALAGTGNKDANRFSNNAAKNRA